MINEQEWVARWEEREVRFRKIVEEARQGYDERIASASERVKKTERTLHEQQAIILKVRSIPLIGKWIIKWAEKKTSTQPGDLVIYQPTQPPRPEIKPPPKPTSKRTSGTRG